MNEMTQVLGIVAMEPKGEWNLDTYYEKLNIVTYNDSTYMAKEGVVGETPSTSDKWQLIGGGLTREDIVDNLDSNDATKMLSAKQGKVLNDKTSQVKYIFPKSTPTTGDYAIIQAYGKNILIDSTASYNWASFKETLDEYGIEKIDIFVLTHFHGDHVGNFINLVDNGYIDENTTMYLPTYDTSLWPGDSAYPYYLDAMQKISDEGLEYINPTEGQTIELSDYCSFSIYNTSEVFAHDNISTNYNDTSMIVIFKHYDITSMFMGDCTREAISYYYSRLYPNLIHLYKMGHHGIDAGNVAASYDIIKNTEIINAVQTIGLLDLQKDKSAGAGTYDDMKKVGADVYVTGYNTENIVFASSNNNLELLNGTSTIGCANTQYKSVDIYVDSVNATTDRQDGSTTYPFKSLTQAVGSIKKDSGFDYTIHLANGTYNTEGGLNNNITVLFGITNSVKIVGESKSGVVLKRGFDIINCSNVSIDKLTIEMAYQNRGIRAINSTINISNVDYIKDSSLLGTQNGFSFDNCIAYVDTCSLDECSHGITETNSYLYLKNITFSNMVTTCIKCIGGTIRHSGIIITDTSPIIIYDGIKGYFADGFELLDTPFAYNTYNDHKSPIKINIATFNKIKVEYTIDNRHQSKVIDVPSADFYMVLDMAHVSSSTGYFSEAQLRINNTTVLIEQCGQMAIPSSGTITITNPYNGLKIESIKGY